MRDGIGPDDFVVTSGVQGIRAGEDVAVVEGSPNLEKSADAATGRIVR